MAGYWAKCALAAAASSALLISTGTGSATASTAAAALDSFGRVSIHLHSSSASYAERLDLKGHEERQTPLSWNQVTSILAHVNGVSGYFRGQGNVVDGLDTDFTSVLNDQKVIAVAGDVFSGPSSSLVVLVKGMSSESLPIPASFYLSPDDPTAGRSVSNYINDFTELVASSRKTRMFTVSSEDQNLAVAGVSRVTLRPKRAVVMLPNDAPASIGKTAEELAKSAYIDVGSNFAEKFGQTAEVFDDSIEADRMFMIETEFVTSFFEALRIQSLSLMKRDLPSIMLSDFFSVSLTRLQGLYDVYGSDSKQYQTGVNITAQAIEDVVKAFESIFASNAVEIISVPPTVPAVGSDEPRLFRRVAAIDSKCPQLMSDCQTVFNNCSNHGVCQKMMNPHNFNQSCFFCSCFKNNTDDAGKERKNRVPFSANWAGPTCAQQDIAAEFHLLLWTAVGLTITIIFVIGLLASTGNDDGEGQKAGAGKHYKVE